MDLGGKMLSDWLISQDAAEFPNGFEYRAGYTTLATHLAQNIHKEVTSTNIHLDGGYLTDHGPDHIRKLIDRISALLTAGSGKLTAYEAYLLLVAAQFHDVGNLFGREKHEEKSAEVMKDVGTLLPSDAIEKRLIYDIAQAHGGKNKDKLKNLLPKDHLRGKEIRPQLLAAILKFGDELAEDSERAARYSLAKGLLPPESTIYHEYAQSLNSVVIDRLAKQVQMKFDLSRSTALKTFVKKSKAGTMDQVYLVDEIMARTVKTHFERVYCCRFMRSVIDLESISVQIEVSDDAGFSVLKRIVFKLEEADYPDTDGKDIFSLCPELKQWDGNGELSGQVLAQKIGALP